MEDRICETCKWWLQNREDNLGTCHLKPPVMFRTWEAAQYPEGLEPGTDEILRHPEFPQVWPHDFCSKHEDK